jgi:hypothetical protein
VTLAKCVIPTEWKYFCYFWFFYLTNQNFRISYR